MLTMVEGMELPALAVTSSGQIVSSWISESKWESFASDKRCRRHFSEDEKGLTTAGEKRVSKIKSFGGKLELRTALLTPSMSSTGHLTATRLYFRRLDRWIHLN
jgi:hypothetical protein